MLLFSLRAWASDCRAVEFGEGAIVNPANGDPACRPGRTAGDALSVHADLNGRPFDADSLEVLDYQIGEIAVAEFVGVEPPQLTDAHFSVVVDGDPRPVIEDSQAGCHKLS